MANIVCLYEIADQCIINAKYWTTQRAKFIVHFFFHFMRVCMYPLNLHVVKTFSFENTGD